MEEKVRRRLLTKRENRKHSLHINTQKGKLIIEAIMSSFKTQTDITVYVTDNGILHVQCISPNRKLHVAISLI